MVSPGSVPRGLATRWPRRIVVEADGGSRGNPGPAAYGALVRDGETGEVIAEAAETIGRATNNVAEYRGLIAGLELARQHVPGVPLEVRMDSKLVVEQMAGRWKVKHPGMRPLAAQAAQLAPADTIWTWVPRERNADADRLLNRALDGATGRSASRTPDRAAGPADSRRASPAPPPSRLVGDGDLGTSTTLLLLRHGETRHTLAARFSGRGGDDPELTEAGHRQAAAAARWLTMRHQVSAVVTSPLRRATQTARVVAERLGADMLTDADLAETDFGDWDGRSVAEVRELWPEQLDAWLTSTDVAPPHGESFAAVGRRVRHARDRLLRDFPGQNVVVVSHGSPIKLLVRSALDAPLPAVFRMEVAPATLTEVAWYADGTPLLRQFATPTAEV
jgi:ribonuclease H / adenosylcobalamin/alpha-ribazole phosphatase